MRPLLFVPITLIVAVAFAIALCKIASIDAHPKELIAAALTCLLAGEAACVPAILARGLSQGAVVQGALIGTAVHLFVSIVVAAVIVIGHVGLGQSYLYWLLGMYWVTMIVLVVAFAKIIKGAAAAAGSDVSAAAAAKH